MGDFVKTKKLGSVKGFSKNTFIGSRKTGMSIVKAPPEEMINMGKLLQFKLAKK